MRDDNTLIIIRSIGFEIMALKLAVVRGADKSLARPGRKQAYISVRMA